MMAAKKAALLVLRKAELLASLMAERLEFYLVAMKALELVIEKAD